jgi:hypothetical protein
MDVTNPVLDGMAAHYRLVPGLPDRGDPVAFGAVSVDLVDLVGAGEVAA